MPGLAATIVIHSVEMKGKHGSIVIRLAWILATVIHYIFSVENLAVKPQSLAAKPADAPERHSHSLGVPVATCSAHSHSLAGAL